MNISTLQTMLLWCSVINYIVLIVWFAVFVLAHEPLYRLHSRWFRLSPEQFDSLHYAGMSVYKMGILLLNLVPFIALWIMNR
jgi:hypothetical protein